MNGSAVNGGFKIWIPWSLVLGATVALVAMYSDVQSLKSNIGEKADREVVTTQYQALLQRLDRIERKIDERRP